MDKESDILKGTIKNNEVFNADVFKNITEFFRQSMKVLLPSILLTLPAYGEMQEGINTQKQVSDTLGSSESITQDFIQKAEKVFKKSFDKDLPESTIKSLQTMQEYGAELEDMSDNLLLKLLLNLSLDHNYFVTLASYVGTDFGPTWEEMVIYDSHNRPNPGMEIMSESKDYVISAALKKKGNTSDYLNNMNSVE
jgi:hypothetical protein